MSTWCLLKLIGGSKMKQHKFFAWATIFCFLLTVITGYEKK